MAWPNVRIAVPGRAAIYIGSSLDVLRTLPSDSVDQVITSPPYYRQRAYGCPVTWPFEKEPVELGWEREAFCVGAGTPAGCGRCYVCHLVLVFREVRRVLKDSGTCWVNLDDKACARGRGKDTEVTGALNRRQDKHPRRPRPPGSGAPVSGVPLNGLTGLPFRLAIALQASGWVWRAWAPWLKRAGMPASMTSRWQHVPEVVHLLAKVSSGYHYDADAVRVPHKPESIARAKRWRTNTHKYADGGPQGQTLYSAEGLEKALHPLGRARRASDFFLESLAHVAAGGEGMITGPDAPVAFAIYPRGYKGRHEATFPVELVRPMVRAGCPAPAPGRPLPYVLDPFGGAGSTGVAVLEHGAKFLGIEAVDAYVDEAVGRLSPGRLTPAGG